MARDKSAVAVIALFTVLGVGGLAGWVLRGVMGTGSPSEQLIGSGVIAGSADTSETSILLPRSSIDDLDENATGDAAGSEPTELGDDETRNDETGDSDSVDPAEPATTAAATPPVDDDDPETATTGGSDPIAPDQGEIDGADSAALPDDAQATDDSSSTSVETTSTTIGSVTASSNLPDAAAPTTAASVATTTAAPATTAPPTTTAPIVLTDPAISAVQFQSPVACLDGSAVAQISWETVDAATVVIKVDGVVVAADLSPSGEFDASFACTDDGTHDVELVATGITSDASVTAFTSSVIDKITTEG